MPDPETLDLMTALSSADIPVRLRAANALTSNPDQDAAPALVVALADVSSAVRKAAAAALEKLGRQAAPTLTFALSSTNNTLRLEATTLLGKIGDESSVPALCTALRD